MFLNGLEVKLCVTMLGRKEKTEKSPLLRVTLQLLLEKVVGVEEMDVTNVERVVIGLENARRGDAVQEVVLVINVVRLDILPESVLKWEVKVVDSSYSLLVKLNDLSIVIMMIIFY